MGREGDSSLGLIGLRCVFLKQALQKPWKGGNWHHKL